MDKIYKDDFPTDSVRKSITLREILISPDIEFKIYEKHGLTRKDISLALTEGNPFFSISGGNQLRAITKHQTYITIFFEYKDKKAFIKTAYISGKHQIRLYKRKNEK